MIMLLLIDMFLM